MNRLVARCRLLLRQQKLRHARKLVVAVVGGSVLLVGIGSHPRAGFTAKVLDSVSLG